MMTETTASTTKFSLEIGTSPYRWQAIDNVVPPPSDGRMMNSVQLLVRMGVAYYIRLLKQRKILMRYKLIFWI